MKMKKITAVVVSCLILFTFLSGCSNKNKGGTVGGAELPLALSYSFDDTEGNMTREEVSNNKHKINYVFSAENQSTIFKPASEPVLRNGVKGKALYMDGFSTRIINSDFRVPSKALTLSAWVAPRVFENIYNYPQECSLPGGHRLTAIISKGEVENGEGFLFGYGRLGMWGIQLALTNRELGEDTVVEFYDPINTLPLYEWSHLAVSFDGNTGYIALFFNGECAYQSIIPELVGTSIIYSDSPLYIGYYIKPLIEFGIERQLPAGLLDEVRIYGASASPKQVSEIYKEGAADGVHPSLEWKDVALDPTVYEGDRYRPQYHALPPAIWMNEPHSPIYYKGRYHVFYQHDPAGPYWSQIRWGHIVSDDMIHWKYVKDAVVPTAGVCPEGVWTGGACIGPDGTPWLVITAGTNTSSWSGQNVAFAHCTDPDDPYLTDWVVEDTVVITQPDGDAQGERDQFRDPFVWYDDGIYYMMVSTSIPGAGGSANIYTSTDMREWEYKRYFFSCDLDRYPEQGAHWECVVMLPISTKDGNTTKYIVFDCPQYTIEGKVVDCYYWIGTFDKEHCRFIPDNPDDPRPILFDLGGGIFTGQNGYCYLTEEDIANGKTKYEQGRTVIYAIAQGKDAGTEQNKIAGWAHNFAMPVELWLSDDGTQVIREPIKEAQSLREEVLYSGKDINARELNSAIANLRGDLLEINATFTLAPTAERYRGIISVRYNPTTNIYGTEKTNIVFSDEGVYIDRSESSLLSYVKKYQSGTWKDTGREFNVKILLDRSMLEVYVNGVITFTTRIYPKYGDSDYLHIFDENAGLHFKEFTVYRMGSAYSDTVTPAYYGNTGDLAALS